MRHLCVSAAKICEYLVDVEIILEDMSEKDTPIAEDLKRLVFAIEKMREGLTKCI